MLFQIMLNVCGPRRNWLPALYGPGRANRCTRRSVVAPSQNTFSAKSKGHECRESPTRLRSGQKAVSLVWVGDGLEVRLLAGFAEGAHDGKTAAAANGRIKPPYPENIAPYYFAPISYPARLGQRNRAGRWLPS
jgi:hypothetical protein